MMSATVDKKRCDFRILIIDDVIANIDVLCKILSSEGYRLSLANNGEKGLQIAKRAVPDLILLDIMMPGINGFEVCRILKSQEETENIPVIFMSALNSTDDKMEGFEAGAVDYVTKPFREKEVLARIQTHLTLYELRKSLETKNIELAKEISERIKAEKALAEKSLYLDNILRSATEYAIATTDLDFRITYYNPMAEKLFGYTAEEVIGKTVQEMHTKENVAPERFERAIKEVRNTGEFRYTNVFKKENSEARYISSRVSGIYDVYGDLIGFALFSRDVTERVKAEEALRKSEQELDYKFRELRTIFETAAEGIIIIDSEGIIECFNNSAEEMFGYERQEVIGHNADILISRTVMPCQKHDRKHIKHYLSLKNAKNRIIGTGGIEIIGKRKDETEFSLNLSVSEFASEKTKFVGIFRDLTERKRLEEITREKLINQRLIQTQREMLESFIQVIAKAIDDKSPYTGGHCRRVPKLTLMLADAVAKTQTGPLSNFSMSDEERYSLEVASWLHDCGKIVTPEYVVDKATKLETVFDRIHLIGTRYEVLKRDVKIKLLQEQLAAQARGEKVDESAFNTKLNQQIQELDKEYDFIRDCNKGSECMSEDWQTRLNHCAHRRWVSSSGKEENFLTEDEIYNLSIAKGTLNLEERKIVNYHIEATIDMLKALPYPDYMKNVPEYAGGHHERMDGKGYPKGLKREQLSIPARIMGIADIFEALTAKDRPYRKAMTLSQALRVLGLMKEDNHIDPDIFEVFIREKVYMRYAEKFLDPQQIDEVDERTIPGYNNANYDNELA